MARVLTKKSTVPGKVPLAADLEIGELAVNTADAKLYTKHSDNTVKQLGIATTDSRLTDAREWTATTVSQTEAETGTATTRRAWTSQRVRQAIAAWWAGSADKTKLDGIATGATANSTDAQLRDRATHTGTQAISTVSGLQTALDGKISTTERGVSGGIPTLDEFARIPASQLPSYVDNVLEFQSLANFPAVGEGGKIYIAINQGTAANPTRQYRWTGSAYAEINPSPGTTDALTEGSTNLYFSESRVRNAVLTGLSFASSAAVAATDSVLSAFGKIQARLNLLGTAATANVQTSPTDTTAGALMAAGAYGIGAQTFGVRAPVLPDADAHTTATGLYRTANTLNFPYGNNALVLIGATFGGGDGSQDRLFELDFVDNGASNVQDIWYRRRQGTTWRNRVKLFHTGNILGTVSQSGGVPTGAIIERGSNANGEYVRFADGTQICRNVSTSLSYAQTVVGAMFTGTFADARYFTFPATFASVPTVTPLAQKTVQGASGGTGAVFPHISNGGPTTTGVNVSSNGAASDVSAYLGYIAIGRWS